MLTIRTVVDPADAALADSLAWQAGVPRAEVRLLGNGTAEWQTLTTDTSGVVQVELGPGLYRLYARRLLTDKEATDAGGVVRVFGDGRTILLTGDTVVTLRLRADQPGGLVISEVGGGTALPWEVGGSSYLSNVYFEIFNNSPQPWYLDGMVFGSAAVPYINTIPTPCPGTEATRNDSTGVHLRQLLRFPGSGATYPIGPGEQRLVAWSAIDHRPVHPTLPDLAHADFEISDAADNPEVPNLINVGKEPFRPQSLFASIDVYMLARPFEPEGLETRFRDSNGREYYYVPAEYLVDVIATKALWPERDAEMPPCVPMIDQRLDRYEGGFKIIGFDANSSAALRSLQRAVLRLDAAGRKILLNTNTTAVDFAYGPRTPGWVPEP